jgi:uncharacterized membrane protein
MMTRTWRLLIFLPWLSLPIIMASFLLLWNKIPAQMAVHFDLSGNANGWMGREAALAFSLLGLLCILALFSWKLRRSRWEKYPQGILRYYFAVALLTVLILGILGYNI